MGINHVDLSRETLEKSADITLKNSLTDFVKEADISQTTKVYFDKGGEPVTRIERQGYYLEWKLEHNCGCGGHGELSLEGDCKCEKSCLCNKMTTEIETVDGSLIEKLTITEKTQSNTFKFIIDTDLRPVYHGREGKSDDESEDLCRHILWIGDDDIAKIEWQPLTIFNHDKSVFVVALYQQQDVDGNISFEIPQAFYENENNYPITIGGG